MKIRIFNGYDYRGKGGEAKEINFIGRVWNLQLMIPFGLSLWRNYRQVTRLNYPAC